MKRILLGAVLLLMLVSAASAYGLVLSGPGSVTVGKPIIVNVTSDLPAGTGMDIVMYRSVYTSTLIDSKILVMQEAKDTYQAIFNTIGLQGGTYKIEARLRSMTGTDLRTGSITSILVEVIDRSGEIHLTSPTTQKLGDALVIEGSIDKIGDSGVQMEVRGPSGILFGPDWISTQRSVNTNEGIFSKTIPVAEEGEYDVSFSDQRGSMGSFIGTVTFTVFEPATTTVATQAPVTVKTTAVPTKTVPATPVPTTPPSPPALATVLISLACAGLAVVMMRR
jgi:hypothetical protein